MNIFSKKKNEKRSGNKVYRHGERMALSLNTVLWHYDQLCPNKYSHDVCVKVFYALADS